MFWIVQKSDSAILGFVSGTQSKNTVAGPFNTYDEAMDAKQGYRRYGCTWYTVLESDAEPKSSSNNYEFSEAHYEFDDV